MTVLKGRLQKRRREQTKRANFRALVGNACSFAGREGKWGTCAIRDSSGKSGLPEGASTSLNTFARGSRMREYLYRGKPTLRS